LRSHRFRTLAAALGLNAELAETLALAHDIGHPPFGHAGEKALHLALKAHGLAFDHNLHALRIVTWFEERYASFRGLNLSLAVREGIVKHSRDYTPAQHPELAEYFLDQFPPLEAQLIDLTDEIAYTVSDLDDGLESGILTLDQIRESVPLFRGFHDRALRLFPAARAKLTANEALKGMLDALATDLMAEIRRRVRDLGATSLDDIRNAPRRIAALGPEMEAQRAEAKRFLYANFYNSPELEESHRHAEEVIATLFAAYLADPSELPADHREQIPTQSLARTVADYIAGMTDAYIEQAWLRCGKP
jgi:dGTPase